MSMQNSDWLSIMQKQSQLVTKQLLNWRDFNNNSISWYRYILSTVKSLI